MNTDLNIKKWQLAALCLGYNELVKMAETLEDKAFWRLARAEAELEYVRLGGKLIFTHEPSLCEITVDRATIKFRESDIELMREAILRHENACE